MYHIPVLLHDSIDALITDAGGRYADLTFGGGGHSREILLRLSPEARLFAFDQDEDALQNKPDDERITLIRANFRFFENFLQFYQVLPLDGILADLGVSSHQFDTAERGFSFRFDADLDMRMDKNQPVTAQLILNEYEENKLADLFYLYGEIRQSRSLAARLVKKRTEAPLATIQDLLQAIKGLWPQPVEKKLLPQIFQALRIEVNDELGALKDMLVSAERALRPGGRLVVISYHSLEDRLVKHFIKAGNFEGKVSTDLFGRVEAPFTPWKAGAIKPADNEIAENPRSRSARLRVGVKI